jgi:hypothetical protein
MPVKRACEKENIYNPLENTRLKPATPRRTTSLRYCDSGWSLEFQRCAKVGVKKNLFCKFADRLVLHDRVTIFSDPAELIQNFSRTNKTNLTTILQTTLPRFKSTRWYSHKAQQQTLINRRPAKPPKCKASSTTASASQ